MKWYRGLALAASSLLLGIALGFALLNVRDTWRPPTIVISDPLLDAEIGASIAGAVATPGMYILPADSRLIHLVEAAGGLTADADLASVNMAARLRDEQQIDIPVKTAVDRDDSGMAILGTPGAALGFASQADARLNINTATINELDALPGIGPALAQLIIEERNRVGRFGSIDDLVRIPGISQRMVDELRNRITT